LRALLETHLGYRQIEDASVSLVVVATDLSTGAERRLRAGPVVPAVLASAAIPGVFAPVPWGSDLLVDGGVVANVPLAAAVAAGADEVWALDTGQLCAERHRPRSAVGVARRSVAVQNTARAETELACLPPGVVVHHVVLPCSTHRWYRDFSGSAELIANGATAAWAALDGIAILAPTDASGRGAPRQEPAGRAERSATPSASASDKIMVRAPSTKTSGFPEGHAAAPAPTEHRGGSVGARHVPGALAT
jgi:NTE family protein